MAEDSKPAKRSLFVKPTWKKPTAAVETVNDGDIFGTGGHLFEDIIADKERLRKEKLVRRQRRESEGTDGWKKRKSSDMEDGNDSWVVMRRSGSQDNASVKARRSASDIEVKSHRGSNPPNAVTSNPPSPMKAPPTRTGIPPQSLASRYEDITKPVKQAVPQSTVVDLLDSDSDDDNGADLYSAPSNKTPANGSTEVSLTQSGKRLRPPNDDSDEEPDPFLRELAAKARARRKAAEAAKAESPSKSTSSTQHFATQPLPTSTSYTSTISDSVAADSDDPVIQIFITSRIPNTNPLRVKRRLKQRLQEVREAWCQKQGFPPDVTASTFLTFRCRRLYDSTTCKSLGIAVDEDGEIVMRNGKSRGVDGICDGRIHMEVCTAEIYEEMKREAAQKLKPKAPEEEAVPTKDKERENMVKLLLKAKGYEDFKLLAKPTSTFEEIANGFRRKRGVPADKQIFLTWDGERMTPTDKLQDTDIADMDSIDVHIK